LAVEYNQVAGKTGLRYRFEVETRIGIAATKTVDGKEVVDAVGAVSEAVAVLALRCAGRTRGDRKGGCIEEAGRVTG
jgi:hypothetical protein